MKILILLLLLGTAPALAERVEHLEVRHEQGAYSVTFRVELAAPPEAVYAALTDFARLPDLLPSLVKSRRLADSAAGRGRVRHTLEGCVMGFCRELAQQWTVHEPGEGVILTRIEPGPSDFSAGWARWRVEKGEGGTRLRYRAELRPSFWVPPVVGPWMIQRNMAGGLRTLARRLEERAASH